MNKISFPIFFAIVFLIANHVTNAEDEDRTKGISITTAEPELQSSQLDKRESRGEINSYDTNLRHPNFNSPNDEPFRPIYRPFYAEEQASTKYESRQSNVPPQTAEIYYGTTQSSNKQEALKTPINAAQTPTTLSGHSGVPLAGSFLSSGVRHHFNTFHGPLNNIVYQKPEQLIQQNTSPKQEVLIKPVTKTQESKKPEYIATHFEKNTPIQNQYYQSPSHPTNLILQSPHYQQRQQPYYQQIYNTDEQPAPVRAIPQHNIQYIIAIPLSHLRQLQQQQQQQQQQHPGHHHTQVPLKSPQPTTGQPARINYGAYQSTQNTNSLIVESEAKPTQQNPVQYTTQYIQLPASVLHAAIQAAHNFQHQRQHVHDQHQAPSYGHTPHHFIYYPPQHQQQGHQQFIEPSQPAPFVVNVEAEKQKPQPESVTYTNGLKTASNAQQKEVRILPTSTATPATTIAHAPFTHSTPIVHYNPVYVQAPPPEQQTIFGGSNYHRFTTGALEVAKPVPFVRLAPVAQPFNHYYTPLHHQTTQQIHPFYRTYEPEQVPPRGLPYFIHPGGVHYGTHLQHPPKSNYIAAPTIPPRSAEATNDKQQQKQNSQQ